MNGFPYRPGELTVRRYSDRTCEVHAGPAAVCVVVSDTPGLAEALAHAAADYARVRELAEGAPTIAEHYGLHAVGLGDLGGEAGDGS